MNEQDKHTAMSKTNLTPQQINEKVISFYNQILFCFLITSGTSFSMEERKKRVQGTFDTAYEILACAYKKKDLNLFNRIYTEALRLASSSNTPRELAEIRADFCEKTVEFIQELKLFAATKGHIR